MQEQKINWNNVATIAKKIYGRDWLVGLIQSALADCINTEAEAELYFTRHASGLNDTTKTNPQAIAMHVRKEKGTNKQDEKPIAQQGNSTTNEHALPKCPWDYYPIEYSFFISDIVRDHFYGNTQGDYQTRQKSPSLPEYLDNDDVRQFIRKDIARRYVLIDFTIKPLRWKHPKELTATELAKLVAQELKDWELRAKDGSIVRWAESEREFMRRTENGETAMDIIKDTLAKMPKMNNIF